MKPMTVHVRMRSGSALLVTVGYLAVLTILASAFLGYLNRTISNGNRHERKLVCMSIAEGGLDKALAELHVRPDEYRGETDTPLGRGMFSVEVTPGENAGQYKITATAELMDDTTVIARSRVVAAAVISPSGRLRALSWSEVKRW